MTNCQIVSEDSSMKLVVGKRDTAGHLMTEVVFFGGVWGGVVATLKLPQGMHKIFNCCILLCRKN
jgi:hypothetical protein